MKCSTENFLSNFGINKINERSESEVLYGMCAICMLCYGICTILLCYVIVGMNEILVVVVIVAVKSPRQISQSGAIKVIVSYRTYNTNTLYFKL